MGEKKPKMGRPRTIPPGAVVWSVRVTKAEKKVIAEILRRMRAEKKGATK